MIQSRFVIYVIAKHTCCLHNKHTFIIHYYVKKFNSFFIQIFVIYLITLIKKCKFFKVKEKIHIFCCAICIIKYVNQNMQYVKQRIYLYIQNSFIFLYDIRNKGHFLRYLLIKQLLYTPDLLSFRLIFFHLQAKVHLQV